MQLPLNKMKYCGHRFESKVVYKDEGFLSIIKDSASNIKILVLHIHILHTVLVPLLLSSYFFNLKVNAAEL